MPLCECSVVSTSPLVLKYSAEQKEQPVILAALAGFPCRIDKMATRTTFPGLFLHCTASWCKFWIIWDTGTTLSDFLML